MDPFRVGAPFLKLKCDNTMGKVVSCLSTSNFIVAYYEKSAFVFPLENTVAKPLYTFVKHSGNISRMIHVQDDVVASVGVDGELLTWCAKTGQVIGEYKVPGNTFSTIAKQSPTMLVVCAREPTASSSSRNSRLDTPNKPTPHQQELKKKMLRSAFYQDDYDDDDSVEYVGTKKADAPQDIKPDIIARPAARKKPAFNFQPIDFQRTRELGRNARVEDPQKHFVLYFITHYEGLHLEKTQTLGSWFVPGMIAGHDNILVYNGVLINAAAEKKIYELNARMNVRCVAINDKIIVIGGSDGNLFFYDNKPGYIPICMFNCNDFYSTRTSPRGAVTSVEIVDSTLVMITTETCGVLFISLKEGGTYKVAGRIIDGAMTQSFRQAIVLKNKDVCVTGVNGYAALFHLPAGIRQNLHNERSGGQGKQEKDFKSLKTEVGILKIRIRKLESEIRTNKINMEEIEAISAAKYEETKSDLNQLKRDKGE